jgi:drug/metabolite transporter (DMT)-like permease
LNKLRSVRRLISSDTINGIILAYRNVQKKEPRIKALIALAIVSVVWGTTWVASKEAVTYMSALQMAGIRQLIAGTLYLGYFLLKKYPLPEKKIIPSLLILAFLNFILSNGLSTWGVKFIPAGLGAIIGAIFPLWLVLYAIISEKSKPPFIALVGMLLGFIGICIVFYEYLNDFFLPEFRFGIMLSITATISWAMGTIYIKQQSSVFNPYFGLGFQMFISGAALYLYTFIFDHTYIPLAAIPLDAWFGIIYLVIAGSIIGFGCYIYTLQHLPAEQAAVYAYINPLIAVLTGWLFLEELLSFQLLIGSIVTIIGIYLVNKNYKNPQKKDLT